MSRSRWRAALGADPKQSVASQWTELALTNRIFRVTFARDDGDGVGRNRDGYLDNHYRLFDHFNDRRGLDNHNRGYDRLGAMTMPRGWFGVRLFHQFFIEIFTIVADLAGRIHWIFVE